MNIANISRRELIREIRSQHAIVSDIGLCFDDCALRVSANATRITDSLSRYFKSFVTAVPDNPDILITVHQAQPPQLPVDFIIKQPDPGKTKIKEEFADLEDGRIVRKRLTGMLFAFGGSEHVAIGPCLENINQVINFINNRFIQWRLCRGGLLGHAAGVVLNGRGLALAGFSGAGKSTLALRLMNRGATFVSNDRLMIETNGDHLKMYGVAKMPRINPGTALNNPALKQIMPPEDVQRFSQMPADALWQVEHKYDAMIEDCYGPERFVLGARMHALILLNWRRKSQPLSVQSVDLARRKDLLPAFMKSVGLFFLPENGCRPTPPTPEAYIDYLSRCQVWECSGGVDFDQVAQHCLRWIT